MALCRLPSFQIVDVVHDVTFLGERRTFALKEIFVHASVQRHIFRQLLFVQAVEVFKESQEVAFSRPVGPYQYIDGEQVELEFLERFISFYFYFVHSLLLLVGAIAKIAIFCEWLGYWLIEINLSAICIAKVLDLFLSNSFIICFKFLISSL